MAGAVAALLLVSACGGGDDSSAQEGPGGQGEAGGGEGAQGAAGPELESHDPPTSFDPGPVAALPEEAGSRFPVALAGQTAFVASKEGLLLVDAPTGQTVSRVEPTHPQREGDNYGHPTAPLITELGGRQAAVVAFQGRIPGEGTTAPRDVVDLVAVDAESGERFWQFDFDLPEWAVGMVTAAEVTVLGVGQGTLLVHVTAGNYDSAVFAVDVADPEVRWQQEDFEPGSMHEDVVVGLYDENGAAPGSRVTALRLGDGTEAWGEDEDSANIFVRPLGPDLALVVRGDSVAAVDPGTGDPQPAAVDAGIATYWPTCDYDEQSVTVCHTSGAAVALDAETGEELWQLPDEANGRIAPGVTAVWHGMVYATTADGPVVLDARTGEDVEPSPGIAPTLVNEYLGVVADAEDSSRWFVHPTTG